MPENRVEKSVRQPHPRLYDALVWLLFLGMVISISRNVYQDQKTDRLARDLTVLRQESQKQIAELRDAQSASLEHDLLRLDQLSAQLAKTNDDALREATTLANRTKLDLAKTVEQRHQEMITAISDLRADLRSDINAREIHAAREVQQASGEGRQAGNNVDVTNTTPVTSSSNSPATASSGGVHDDPWPAPSPKKKRLWDKLNPFSKKKQDGAVSGLQ